MKGDSPEPERPGETRLAWSFGGWLGGGSRLTLSEKNLEEEPGRSTWHEVVSSMAFFLSSYHLKEEG